MERRSLNLPVSRTRRPLVLPPIAVATVPRRALTLPAVPARPRHPLAGPPPLPVEQWPDKVYGYHPLLPMDEPHIICVYKSVPGHGIPGHTEVSPEINPLARNREMGISEGIADAVIRAAFAPNGPAWAKRSTF